MDAIALLNIVSNGETSQVQFKEKLPHADSFAAELAAMSNALGGIILIGVADKTGDIVGLNQEELRQYGSLITNISTNNIDPVIYVTTEIVNIEDRKVLVVHIDEGIDKPYKDNKGVIWTKAGPDKRKVLSNAEIARLLQSSGTLLAEEMPIAQTSIDDVDQGQFSAYFLKEFGETYEQRGLSFEQALKAKRVLKGQRLSLAGLLFFGKNPQEIRPAFTIKAVSFFGNRLEGTQYRNKPVDLRGTIPKLFRQGMDFLIANLKHTQQGQDFNSIGKLEVSQIALEELLQNALIHRDYFKNALIRLLIFDNRIEIISPGSLPNSLTVEEMKFGNPAIRNNQLVAFGIRTLPFSGLGSGVPRALSEQPDIEFFNDADGRQFFVTIPRPPEEYPA